MHFILLLCLAVGTLKGEIPSEYSASVELVNDATGETRTWQEWRGGGWVIVLDGTTLRGVQESSNGDLWGYVTRHLSGGTYEGHFETLYHVLRVTWMQNSHLAVPSEVRSRQTLHYPSGIYLFANGIPLKVEINNTNYNILQWVSQVDASTLSKLTSNLAKATFSRTTLRHSDYTLYVRWFVDGKLTGFMTEITDHSAEITTQIRTYPDGNEVTVVMDKYVGEVRICDNNDKTNITIDSKSLYADHLSHMIETMIDLPQVSVDITNATHSSDWLLKEVTFNGILWSVSGFHNLSVYLHRWEAIPYPSCVVTDRRKRVTSKCTDTCCQVDQSQFNETALCSIVLLAAIFGILISTLVFFSLMRSRSTPPVGS